MWYRIPAYEALWPLLDQINAEMDAKMEQAAPTHPGIIGVGQCANCARLVSDLEAAHIDLRLSRGFNEQYVKQLATAHKTIAEHEQTIAELSQQLRNQHNEHLRMDREIKWPH